MRDLEPLLATLREIGVRHGASPGQVALAWVVAKGAVPLAGAKNAEQASQNAGALKVNLTAQEVAQLSSMGRAGGTSNWQHG